jgi:hypothetical protein
MRSLRALLPLALLAVASAQQDILPVSFSGWESKAKALPKLTDADVLNEYGLQQAEVREYARGDRRITVKALRFTDATGAYGAFTFYRQPDMVKEDLGFEAASARMHVVFFSTNVFVDAQLDKVTAMTMAELRDLVKALPKQQGPASQPPSLPLYLPHKVRNSTSRFAVGARGYTSAGSPLPAELLDFSLSPEVIVSKLPAIDGSATVTLLQYPTPAIAIQQLKRFEAWGKTQSQSAPPNTRNTILARRSGPLVAVVTGDIANAEAFELIGKINYEADVNWTEPTYQHPKDNIGGIVYTSVLLAIIIFAATVVVGIAFGGFRIVLRKLFPDRFPDPAEHGELIRLKIDR